MNVRFGSIYVTKDIISPSQQRRMENAFHSHLSRGSIQMYAPPDSWARAVIVTPEQPYGRIAGTDEHIETVLKNVNTSYERLY